ncbi:MAG TPA: hypothetical protein DD671_10400 [Balneolaceae bacterium]|nr:hypothetical protein [Balneola sp.]HBQ60010.1 hypothetical protein [Balneolaceae bacterium]|tara:strand:- start:129994 stop:130293 length:300 start_codon:yes stop_codon:yes gene_type:complete
MKNSRKNIAGVVGAILLFFSFTIMHEFGWLIPPSPVQTVADTSPVPLPDVIEEHGSEDEIEHEDADPVFISPLKKARNTYMVFRNLYVPSVATPPPDMI